MKILQAHSDFIEYEAVKKEIKEAEEIKEKKKRFEDILVLFTCIEKGDEKGTARKLMDEVKNFLEKIKVKRVLIYPFAHLSNRVASPRKALELLKEMENYSKKIGIETYRAPFGWTKSLKISIKGHPLAEQFRSVSGEEKEVVSKALKAEEKLKSEWFILEPSGKLFPIKKFDFSKHVNLEKFAKYEIAKSRAVHQIPPHVRLMRKLEIADYEPGSDPGNMRWYPKGKLIKSLLEEFVTRKVVEYGGMEVETPVMYDFQHPSLSNYLNRFPARQYVVKSEDKEFFLRFSACFGQFLMLHDAQISYRQLPLRLYELTRYSFRREKSGELVGLRRLRAFTMPDVHAICKDLKQAKEEFKRRFKLCVDVLDGIGLKKEDYEMAIRFTKDFYEENKDFVNYLVKSFGKPVLVEVWSKRFFYFALKWEFNFIDNLDKASALSTDQIDVENSKRYGITFVDKDGKKKYPIILHCSPSGAIERCIYALLEKAYSEQKMGKIPQLPLWLSPIQVRLIPVSDKFMDKAKEIAEKLEKNCIRVDIDDRRESVERKIRDAEVEWIPYSVVIGEKEIKTSKVSVRIRKEKKVKSMKLEDLIERIRKEVNDKPFKPLPLPKLLSERPVFVG